MKKILPLTESGLKIPDDDEEITYKDHEEDLLGSFTPDE